MSTTLIDALQNEALFDHPIAAFTTRETHISQVLLTGPYAYKIKKPLNFGFLDFSTLARRKFFCEEELRLNRRLAPDLYLDVLARSRGPRSPRNLGGMANPSNMRYACASLTRTRCSTSSAARGSSWPNISMTWQRCWRNSIAKVRQSPSSAKRPRKSWVHRRPFTAHTAELRPDQRTSGGSVRSAHAAGRPDWLGGVHL